jgi:hypothetical protein
MWFIELGWKRSFQCYEFNDETKVTRKLLKVSESEVNHLISAVLIGREEPAELEPFGANKWMEMYLHFQCGNVKYITKI